jgi:hypothetical protein
MKPRCSGFAVTSAPELALLPASTVPLAGSIGEFFVPFVGNCTVPFAGFTSEEPPRFPVLRSRLAPLLDEVEAEYRVDEWLAAEEPEVPE